MSDHHNVALASVASGAFFLYQGFVALKERNLIRNIPTSKIRSAAMGLVELKGTACETQEPLTAPVSNKECVYYSYKIQKYRSSKHGGHWRTLKHGSEGNYFWLRDDTGTVLVDTSGAKIKLSVSATKHVRNAKPELLEFIKSKGVNYQGLLGTKNMRVVETIIYPGQPLYVMGTAKDNPHVDDATVTEGFRDLMIGQGEHYKYFLITNKKEKDLLRTRELKILGLLAGPFLIVGGLWMLTW